ncbi:hypothetical protein GCK72_003473 [Caenorhabditis remanei]|uniref:F-box domain-containing protein n=1 Tax=Caenorhabditis remanei TaxID=31234 RepID=A0A6A5HXB2_CAERE|nr:hypothetical protein GCK72_003473 [Caenorhabditis remanei]KAF1771646.1 hypothetical protein GCK72_003473 [Caenorhabditis remanei]
MSPLPLLRLPFLPLQNIIQNWNIYEICQFAKVSKRTRNIAKVATRKSVKITLYSGESFVIDTFFTEKGFIVPWNHRPETWRLELKDVSERDNTESEDLDEYDRHHTLNLFSDNPLLLFLETLEFLFNVFDCSIHSVYWNGWKSEDMRQVIDWMNGCDKLTTIRNVRFMLNVNNQMTLALFLETYQKKLGRNWKEGKSNSILEALRVFIPGQEDWRTVLNGLGAVVRHPTQVTRCYIEKVWFYGGVDIQRVDGTIGTVIWTHYQGRSDQEMIPKNIIEAFEKTKQEWVGTDSDVVFEERGDMIQVSNEEEIIEQRLTENSFNFSFVVWK